MSCTTPSVSITTPASRSGGTSASAWPSAANSRVPSSPSLASGTSMKRGSMSVQRAEAALQLGPDRVGHLRPVAERLRAGAVDHDGHDVLHRLALLPHQGGIGERRQHQGERQRAQQRGPARAPGRRAPPGRRRSRPRTASDRPREERREAEAQHGARASGSCRARECAGPSHSVGRGARAVGGGADGHRSGAVALPLPPAARPPSPQRGEGSSAASDCVKDITAPAAPAGRARGPGPPCSCRSACTSRC